MLQSQKKKEKINIILMHILNLIIHNFFLGGLNLDFSSGVRTNFIYAAILEDVLEFAPCIESRLAEFGVGENFLLGSSLLDLPVLDLILIY